MSSKQRTQQVAGTIQRVLGDVIQNELKDPRVGFATVVGVDVSADIRHARVRISIMGDEQQRAETMSGLRSAQGFLRRRIAEEMRHLRFVPELRLQLDTSLDYSMRIDTILRDIKQEQEEHNQANQADQATNQADRDNQDGQDGKSD